MNKTYLRPETVVTDIELQQMIAGSPLTTENGDVVRGELQNENATGAALSRGSIWDED